MTDRWRCKPTKTLGVATTLHSPISVGERIVWNFINVGHFDCLVGLEIMWVQAMALSLKKVPWALIWICL